jgi:hypothetical protein
MPHRRCRSLEQVSIEWNDLHAAKLRWSTSAMTTINKFAHAFGFDAGRDDFTVSCARRRVLVVLDHLVMARETLSSAIAGDWQMTGRRSPPQRSK